VTSVSGDLTLHGGVGGSDPNYTVPASSLADNGTVTTQARCDLSPDTPTGIPVLLKFQSTGDATARWSGVATPSASGITSVTTTGAGNVATANLILVDGEDGDSFAVTCYLDYGATGVLESTDPLLDTVTIEVTSGS